MNLSFKSTGKTSEMMRKVGLEADSGLRRVILLQGFATRSLQINIFDSYYMALYCGGKHNVLLKFRGFSTLPAIHN
jgi:hypothetical protein